jgi:hypothetical protein
MHRIMRAQRGVVWERIVDEVRRQALEVEVAHGRHIRHDTHRTPGSPPCQCDV